MIALSLYYRGLFRSPSSLIESESGKRSKSCYNCGQKTIAHAQRNEESTQTKKKPYMQAYHVSQGSKVGILCFALARIGAEVSAMRMQEQKERCQKGTPL